MHSLTRGYFPTDEFYKFFLSVDGGGKPNTPSSLKGTQGIKV